MTKAISQFEIELRLDQHVILNSIGATFHIYDKRDGKDNTKKLGTLIVSGGGLRFIPAGHRRPYRVSWGELTEIMKVFGHHS